VRSHPSRRDKIAFVKAFHTGSFPKVIFPLWKSIRSTRGGAGQAFFVGAVHAQLHGQRIFPRGEAGDGYVGASAEVFSAFTVS
jgi:hypothetical protein